MILQDKVKASGISEYLVGSLELESLCTEARSLWKSTKKMSEEIKMIDPTTLDDTDATQAVTDTEVSNELHPLELKVTKLVTLCREAKEKADTVAAREAASASNAFIREAPGSGGGLGLERLKLPVFTGKLADYPSFKEDWSHLVHGNLDPHTEKVMIRENIPKTDRIELKT